MAVNSFWHENLNEDLDQDNDGISDIQERFGTIGEGFASCWVGELNWTSNITNDYDQDGCRDATEDLDDDNDGFTDSDEMENCGEGNDPLDEDDYPSNNDEDWGDLWISWSRYGYEEWYSLAFRLCDYLDPDDDNDGFVDSTELECNSDPMYSISQPVDTDGDTVCDPQDYDDDGDGYLDSNDDFPLNDSEWLDTDNDGIGDNSDVDVDGDGWTNSEEERCGTNPMVYSDAPLDTDADRICDMFDDDDDNDGVGDLNDVFPLDWAEWADNDMDGIGDNADSDDDNDGFPDNIDNWPFNPCISTDSDSDGLPDFLMLNCEGVEDFDDDDDLVLDVNDFCSPGEVGWISGAAIGTDYDGDGCRDDGEDTDDDNDGVEDSNDQCPRGHTGWISNPINDIDGDGCHESEDFDRDGDGVGDIEDAFPDDPTEWADSDGDGVGDNSDSGDTADKGNYNLAIMVFLSLTAVVVIVWKMKSS